MLPIDSLLTIIRQENMTTNADLRVSDILMSKIKEFEGCSLTAYKCPGGKWTVGIGHVGGVRKGMTITAEQADELLASDIAEVESRLRALDLPTLTVPRWDAICDFVFNLGIGNFKSSTLLAKIRGGSPDAEIQAEFRRWVYAGGKKLDGLVKRREWEAQRWIS